MIKSTEIKFIPIITLFKDFLFKHIWYYLLKMPSLLKVFYVYCSPKEPPPPKEEPAWNTVKSAVQHLTGDNFAQVTREKDVTMVMFYAPWCGHCKKSKPEYQVTVWILLKFRNRSAVAVNCWVVNHSLEVSCNVEYITSACLVTADWQTVIYYSTIHC